MLVIITFRIKDPKLRVKVVRKLKNYGKQINTHFFECRLSAGGIKQLKGGFEDVKSKLGPGDTLRIYPVCRKCVKYADISGTVPLTREPLYFIV